MGRKGYMKFIKCKIIPGTKIIAIHFDVNIKTSDNNLFVAPNNVNVGKIIIHHFHASIFFAPIIYAIIVSINSLLF